MATQADAEAAKKDYIKINKPIGNAVVTAIVKPIEDGDFEFSIHFACTGNGQPNPEMWSELSGIDGKTYVSDPKTKWKDGPTGLVEVFAKGVKLEGGKLYNIRAEGKNNHADANDIKLFITRV